MDKRQEQGTTTTTHTTDKTKTLTLTLILTLNPDLCCSLHRVFFSGVFNPSRVDSRCHLFDKTEQYKRHIIRQDKTRQKQGTTRHDIARHDTNVCVVLRCVVVVAVVVVVVVLCCAVLFDLLLLCLCLCLYLSCLCPSVE